MSFWEYHLMEIYVMGYIASSFNYYDSAKWLRVCTVVSGFWMLYCLHIIPGKLVIDRRRTHTSLLQWHSEPGTMPSAPISALKAPKSVYPGLVYSSHALVVEVL